MYQVIIGKPVHQKNRLKTADRETKVNIMENCRTFSFSIQRSSCPLCFCHTGERTYCSFWHFGTVGWMTNRNPGAERNLKPSVYPKIGQRRARMKSRIVTNVGCSTKQTKKHLSWKYWKHSITKVDSDDFPASKGCRRASYWSLILSFHKRWCCATDIDIVYANTCLVYLAQYHRAYARAM